MPRAQITAPAITALAWPWLTFTALMVFRRSMRRAKISKRHVLRAVIYGCDFPVSILLVALIGVFLEAGTSWLLAIAFVCALLAMNRLTFAYRRYLRFHLPFQTVLASQVIVFLFAFVMLLRLGLLR